MKKKSAKKNNSKQKKTVKRRKKVKQKKLIGMEMEQIYALINITQIKKIKQEIIIEPASAPVIENILKDCQMPFTKKIEQDGFHYIIQPPPERKIPDEAFIFTKEMADELTEDGFCF